MTSTPRKKAYSQLKAMVAFSGEVTFSTADPNCEGLLGETFTETGMNPDLMGRDLRKAFDSNEYHVMIVAQKFQTGFDQPKLCAMYVDKKLDGLEYVQTLSRLNRTYPGKQETYVLDFFNQPEEVLVAFTRYYEFMSQIVDYDSHDLEKLSLYARHLAPLLREKTPDDDPIDLSSVELSHYRLSKLKQQDLLMVKEGADAGLYAVTDLGTGKPKKKQEERLSQIIARLNELFVTDGLTDQDLVN